MKYLVPLLLIVLQICLICGENREISCRHTPKTGPVLYTTTQKGRFTQELPIALICNVCIQVRLHPLIAIKQEMFAANNVRIRQHVMCLFYWLHRNVKISAPNTLPSMQLCMYVCMYLRMYAYMYVCTCVYMYACMYGMVWYGMLWYGMYVSYCMVWYGMYVLCTYVCMYVRMYTSIILAST
jgi:hypothetical protein